MKKQKQQQQRRQVLIRILDQIQNVKEENLKEKL